MSCSALLTSVTLLHAADQQKRVVLTYNDTGGNLTGSSKELAKGCIYFNAPITLTFSGLTDGQRYQATFFSLA